MPFYDELYIILQDLQAEPSTVSCYVLLALFREITTGFSGVNREEQIPAGVSSLFVIECIVCIIVMLSLFVCDCNYMFMHDFMDDNTILVLFDQI